MPTVQADGRLDRFDLADDFEVDLEAILPGPAVGPRPIDGRHQLVERVSSHVGEGQRDECQRPPGR